MTPAAGTVIDLTGWTPARISEGDGRWTAEWCHTAGMDFDDPFFDQTIERCLRHPFRLLFTRTTTLDEVVAWAGRQPGVAPAGFVFHGSRCGSTLVTQLLQQVPSTLCLSEPGPLDSVLRLAVPNRAEVLRAVVSALAQPRRPEHHHAVVKLDAWSVLQLPLVRAAFPDVPWVFVYRDPVEVLVSQLGHRGFHMVPGTLPAAALGLTGGGASALAPEEFVAHVLGHLYTAGLAGHVPGRSLLVNHRDLPGAVETIAAHFEIALDGAARSAMQAVANRDAKNPQVPYVDDRAAKRRAASPALLAAVAHRVAPAYEALEAAR